MTTMMCCHTGCPRKATRFVVGRFWAKGYARMADDACEFEIEQMVLCDSHEPPTAAVLFAGEGGEQIRKLFARRGLAEPDLDEAHLFTRRLGGPRPPRAKTVH